MKVLDISCIVWYNISTEINKITMCGGQLKMRTITMKKLRTATRFISRLSLTIGIGIIIFWIIRYDFCLNHSTEIFKKAFITSIMFLVISSFVGCISVVIQSYINSRYRKVHIKEQEIQLLIEDVRMKTVLK